MNWHQILCTAIVCLALTACQSTTKYVQAPRSAAPANITAECDQLPPMRGRTMGDWVTLSTVLGNMYNECKSRHDRLVEWLDRV